MSDLRKYIDKQMENEEFRKEHEATRAEFNVTRAIIEARTAEGLTQKELAERSGLRQSNISRIENGTCSPTVSTLQMLAEGLGKKLSITFL
ncbi:MAG: helix-turn-helix transcriptional regulator [Eubacterium sp.]|nr:helix-turn-helix transcriptional regulator [Eubacterium sp.]